MKWIVEDDACKFEFWGAAKDLIDIAKDLGTFDTVMSVLEELCDRGDDDLLTDVDINDYVSFYMADEYPELFGYEGMDY